MHFKISSVICFNLDQFKILSSGNGLTLYHTIPIFNDPEKKKKKKRGVENIVGKGENAGNQHFLLFPQCFLTIPESCCVSNPLPNDNILDGSILKKHLQTIK